MSALDDILHDNATARRQAREERDNSAAVDVADAATNPHTTPEERAQARADAKKREDLRRLGVRFDGA